MREGEGEGKGEGEKREGRGRDIQSEVNMHTVITECNKKNISLIYY